MTAELTVSFVKPVPVQRPLEVRAWVEKREGRRWYIAGEMVLLPTRAVLARVSGIWVTLDQGHFARHQEWLAGQDGEARTQQPAGQDGGAQQDLDSGAGQ